MRLAKEPQVASEAHCSGPIGYALSGIPACEERPVWGRYQNESQGLEKGRAFLGSYPLRDHSLLHGALPAIATLLASLAARFPSNGRRGRENVRKLWSADAAMRDGCKIGRIPYDGGCASSERVIFSQIIRRSWIQLLTQRPRPRACRREASAGFTRRSLQDL